MGTKPYGIFVDRKNTVYINAKALSKLRVWQSGNVLPPRITYNGPTQSYGLFVTINEDVYIDNGRGSGTLNVWGQSVVGGTAIMNTSQICFGLFVAINGDVYCSTENPHQVTKSVFYVTNRTRIVTIAAGNSTNGSSATELATPRAIFVDQNFNLYVADCDNHRIQFFSVGQRVGKTLAGNGAPGTITLQRPTGLVVDADGYLFIADTGNSRIVGQGPNGFRCIVGCSRINASGPLYLNSPWSLSFDNVGNLFVVDAYNDRVQQFTLASNSCGITYNQPRVCSTANWDPRGITVASGVYSSLPNNIYVDRNNSVYITSSSMNLVFIWSAGSSVPTRNLSNGLSSPNAVVASFTGDIYIDNGGQYGRVERWASNAINGLAAMLVSSSCHGLFIDINDNLYCSLFTEARVVKTVLMNGRSIFTVVAGNGVQGSAPHQLYYPRGIFVDEMMNLYVADCSNNRIQLFPSGQMNGTTVLGNGAVRNIVLNQPSSVILDADKNLYIAELSNNRIIRFGASGLQCIAGCSMRSGAASDQLNLPHSLSFDSYGNIYVADTFNNRSQKFILSNNSCGKDQCLS